MDTCPITSAYAHYLDVTEARTAVARGAALLDACKPGWHNYIDRTTLDLDHAFLCILGQLYGQYMTGLATLRHYAAEHPAFGPVQMWTHGFSGNAALLEVEWHLAISERRKADVTAILAERNAPSTKDLVNVSG